MKDKHVALTLFYIFYDAEARSGEIPPYFLALLLFGMF